MTYRGNILLDVKKYATVADEYNFAIHVLAERVSLQTERLSKGLALKLIVSDIEKRMRDDN
jgi:hypothetical protein